MYDICCVCTTMQSHRMCVGLKRNNRKYPFDSSKNYLFPIHNSIEKMMRFEYAMATTYLNRIEIESSRRGTNHRLTELCGLAARKCFLSSQLISHLYVVQMFELILLLLFHSIWLMICGGSPVFSDRSPNYKARYSDKYSRSRLFEYGYSNGK